MLNKNKILFIFAAMVFVGITPHLSYAETIVHQQDMVGDVVWNKEGSPYIIDEPIRIASTSSLTIKQGTIVTSTGKEINPRGYIWTEGSLKILGTKDNPILYNALATLFIVNTNAFIRYTTFASSSLSLIESTTTIEYSTFKNAIYAVAAKNSRLTISTSTLDNNGAHSLYSREDYSLPRLYNPGDPNSIYVEDPRQNLITMHGSRIINAASFEILNETDNNINATNNWWGRKEGPKRISSGGKVFLYPMLEEDPDTIKAPECCSSVLFIPGLEASRLYKDTKGIFGTSTNTLWEPNRNDDIKKMYMDSNGISIDSTIYTKDIMDSAFGLKNIYKSFIDSMDNLVKTDKINDWLPLPYDWRKGVHDIVGDDLILKVKNLSDKSKNKKITIIAHSNGGLVAKELVQRLEERGMGDIVENIIYVAVPELGTPEAILSMLHGHSQDLAFGMVLSKNNSRMFSQNMLGAYGLLPSQKFFENNPITVISDMFKNYIDISSFVQMKNFVLSNIFSKASTTETNIPLLLNSYLFSLADSFHLDIDNWKPASTTKTLSIFGWGLPTSKGIQYKQDPHCEKNISTICSVESMQISENSGDGTVLTKSNSGNSDSTIYFNLNQLHSDLDKNINHANILESQDLLLFLNDKIVNKNVASSSYQKYFSVKEPNDDIKTVTARVYSPVDIDVYDNSGRHTGIKKNPNPDSDFYLFDDEIPGVSWDELGDVKSVTIPYNKDIKVKLTGNDTGTFIVDIELKKGNEVMASTSFAELPVTVLSSMDLVFSSTTESFATSTVLDMDVDGDGQVDFVGRTNTYLQATGTNIIKDLPSYLETIKKVITSLKLPLSQEEYWLGRIVKISNSIDKNKYKKVDKIIKQITRKSDKNTILSESQKNIILKSFDNMLIYIENSVFDSKDKI